MIFICLGLAAGTCDAFAIPFAVAFVAFPMLLFLGLVNTAKKHFPGEGDARVYPVAAASTMLMLIPICLFIYYIQAAWRP